jgi:Zn ribbon nucleic-acid-binding protein
MDFIFEEDMDEVGSDIEAYCPKCKADTAHTVITKYEDEVRRVQCSTCGDVHAFRKPRGEVEDEIPEPIAAKKRAAAKKPSWQEAIDKIGVNKANNLARPYSIRDHYHENDIVSHPKFGVGFVTEISENKAEVTFQDERRVLVHNRPDLAAQMPAIAPTPAPRAEKVKGGKKSDKSKDKRAVAVAPVVAPPPPAAKSRSTAGASKPPAAPPPAAKKPEPAKKAPVAAVQAKVDRAKAAVAKKGVAKGKVAPAKPAAPAAKAAAPARAAKAATASRVRPAGRAARPEPTKSKIKKKAGKAR